MRRAPRPGRAPIMLSIFHKVFPLGRRWPRTRERTLVSRTDAGVTTSLGTALSPVGPTIEGRGARKQGAPGVPGEGTHTTNGEDPAGRAVHSVQTGQGQGNCMR